MIALQEMDTWNKVRVVFGRVVEMSDNRPIAVVEFEVLSGAFAI